MIEPYNNQGVIDQEISRKISKQNIKRDSVIINSRSGAQNYTYQSPNIKEKAS